ncbi:patatin-like phospholipase family protein [Micromonospora sp. H61]|uniref:CBASS cGAMP-activated phospholipase n=1 Tax=Micromonospora sp. H61 TaxID=2824888 RepID=UPI001B36FACA|nr:CBASS cGAMP-activated phospholipase [Micromonospora sp. H61]MBQ0991570.1 patatin-like phospholipase family protein [Micromonospora sp. H61]
MREISYYDSEDNITGDSGHIDKGSAARLPAHERFQVLALDGGGGRALFTAHVLARLEADLDLKVVDSFDLIAGTSAGGIIALGLGAGMRPAQLVEHCVDLAKGTFPRFRRARWHLLPRIWDSARFDDGSRGALIRLFGPRRFGESTKRLIIPSWDARRGEVHIFKTPHHMRLRRDGEISMVDVAMATTSAPRFLAAATANELQLIDGGVWANNPSVVAIGEAVSMLGVPLEAIHVLSLGTVDQRTNHFESLTRGRSGSRSESAETLMITASSRGAQGTAIHLVGNENFTRFDARLPELAMDLSSSASLDRLIESHIRALRPVYTEKFAEHLASPYTPNP